MIDIFLSSSVPLPSRNRHFFLSADVLAIREAIKALVEVVLPVGRLTFGGHPAITPLIAHFVQESGLEKNRLTVFQSRYFERSFPDANAVFHDIRLVDAVGDNRQLSLNAMRRAMLESRPFHAAVVIGGMEGAVEEIDLFQQLQPEAVIFPVASTGAAAADIYDRGGFPVELKSNLTYTTLFRRQLLNG